MAGRCDYRLPDGGSSVVSHIFEVSSQGDSKAVVIDPSLEYHVGQAPSVVGVTSPEPMVTSDVVRGCWAHKLSIRGTLKPSF